jgi:hypothetical protein
MRSICLGLAILLGSVLGASADDTPEVGGPGGSHFDDACHGTDVMIGFNITENKALNTIAAVCQPQNNGVLVGANYGLRTWGTLPEPTAVFTGSESYRCPAGQAMFGFTIWVNKLNELDSVAATCVPLSPDGGTGAQLPRSVTVGGVSVSESAIGCGLGGIAVGITGRSSGVMNSLGLKCNPNFPWHVAQQPPPTNIVRVVAAADIYNTPDPQGAATYVDGLDPANTVLVYLLEVGPDNWYRVTWNGAPPQPLWVYSGPGNYPFELDSLATAKATLGGH